MRKIALMICLLVVTVAAQAQFEKGKWFVNPSVSGLALSHDTESGKTTFGLEAQGGAFLMDNLALLIDLAGAWNAYGSDVDIYSAGVGCRYYFDKVGVYVGANLGANRYEVNYDGDNDGRTLCRFGLEAGYAFFLSRNVTIEPAAYWNVDKDRSQYGLKVGFGFYF